VAASRRQGLGLEQHDYAADAPGKESGGRAHREGRTSVGQSGGARRRPHRREGRRRLRLAPGATGEDEGGEGGSKMKNGGGLGGSHRGGGEGTATAAFDDGKSGRGAATLASKAGGTSHGRTGEAAACLSSGERERSGTAADAFERA
jgi:hypothetical protein